MFFLRTIVEGQGIQFIIKKQILRNQIDLEIEVLVKWMIM